MDPLDSSAAARHSAGCTRLPPASSEYLRRRRPMQVRMCDWRLVVPRKPGRRQCCQQLTVQFPFAIVMPLHAVCHMEDGTASRVQAATARLQEWGMPQELHTPHGLVDRCCGSHHAVAPTTTLCMEHTLTAWTR